MNTFAGFAIPSLQGGGSPATGRGGGAGDGEEGRRGELRPSEEVLHPDLEVKAWRLAGASGGPKRHLRPWVSCLTPVVVWALLATVPPWAHG
jgi:hypothetical protein